MSPRHATPAHTQPRHARTERHHRLVRGTALTVTAVLAFGTAGAATAYTRLQGNIDSADVEALLGDDRPEPIVTPDPNDPNKGLPVNILVMGTDSRVGSEDLVTDPGQEGQRSDTTIVVHISADRSRAELVSIPRDSLVDIPECDRSDGTSARSQKNTMFNSAFSIGGQSGEVSDAAACTQRTVESLTGVYINHFVVVNMSGFVAMVNALGGIPMCIPQDMRSPKAHLDISAGMQTLDGVTALAFARARTGEGLGNGSDLNRIGRQQELLAATARTVLSKNLLTDVPELLKFLGAATSSLTVSSSLAGIPDMAGLAFSLQGIPSGNITFMTIPNRPAPSDRNRVEWTDEADAIWANMAADLPIVATADEATTAEPTSTAAPDAGSTAATPAATPPPSSSPPDSTETTPASDEELLEPGVDPFTSEDQTAVCG